MGETAIEDNYEIYSDSDSDKDSDGLPFRCPICEDFISEPTETACVHVFCEPCALRHYASDKRCFTCHKSTKGVFNTQKRLAKKLRSMSPDTLEAYQVKYSEPHEEEEDVQQEYIDKQD